MAVTQVTTAGTVQVKLGGGRLYNVVGISAGTSMTYQIKDGPDVNGNSRLLFGGTAIPVVAGQNLRQAGYEPIQFTNGLQFVIGGTPGEVDVEFD